MTAPAATRTCPLTEAADPATPLGYAPNPWLLKQCNKSGFVYLANPPAYETLIDDFAWQKTWQQEADRRQGAEPVRYAVSTSVKRFRAQVLKRNKVRTTCLQLLKGMAAKPRINVLDIGCAQGNVLLSLFDALPADVAKRCVPYGIEISSELAHEAQANFSSVGGTCVHDNALNGIAALPMGHLHLVIMSSFLEHEVNPLPLLRRCQERLAPGGFIVIKVPNFDCLNRHVRGAKWCGFRWPDHVNYFTPATLTAMVERAGLQVARMNWMDKSLLSDSLYAVVQK